MAVKRVSQFPEGIPTASDKILFEQDGNGKNATIEDAVNTCSLTFEEIMASTDLSGKVASASVLKSLNGMLSEFSVLRTKYAYEDSFDLDDLSSYPSGSGILFYTMFTTAATGSKPFPDGHLLSFIWRNKENSPVKVISQLAIEDDQNDIKYRFYSTSNTWSSWKTISIS